MDSKHIQCSLVFFQEHNCISIALADGPPPPPPPSLLPSPSHTDRYLKLLLPCSGMCDVTGGISNVILVSRRDRSHKCLMNHEALCSDRSRRFLGCPRWKGLFKESPVSIRARWKPSSAQESGGSYHIHMSVCTSACKQTYSCVLSFLHLLFPSSCIHRFLFPASAHTPLGAIREQYFYLLDIYHIWQV